MTAVVFRAWPRSRAHGEASGRKRYIVTDALGLLLVVTVTAANIGDRTPRRAR
ncbi:hypothetical protein ACFYU9_05210 [Streptomyces sp. NPDC004327]|uniref:hypothetical protein n=1 Tax=Streptomyces sp. NPDC004327 TaxID=3364699 RepID=UPI0036885925